MISINSYVDNFRGSFEGTIKERFNVAQLYLFDHNMVV
jgi:hypothetical protein